MEMTASRVAEALEAAFRLRIPGFQTALQVASVVGERTRQLGEDGEDRTVTFQTTASDVDMDC